MIFKDKVFELRYRIRHAYPKGTFGKILMMLTILLALGFLVFLSQQVQKYRSRANFSSASAFLSFSPVSGLYAKDEIIRIDVGINANGDLVRSVETAVLYPTTKLEFVDISISESALTTFTKKEAANGMVQIAGVASSPGFNGEKHIATLAFKVIDDTGVASFSFYPDSLVLRNSDNANILTGRGVANFTLGKAGGIPLETTSSGFNFNSPDGLANTLALSDIVATDITKNSAVVSWHTDINANSLVEFGQDITYGNTLSSEELVTDHRVLIQEGMVTAGTTHHFRVRSVSPNKEMGQSIDYTFKTKGYEVVVGVTDASGNPVSGATVSIYSDVQTIQTDDSGEAHFSGVSLGRHGVIVKHNNQTLIEEVEVSQGDLPTYFSVSFLGNTPLKNNIIGPPVLYSFTALLLVLIISFGVYGIAKEKREARVVRSLGY